MVSFCDKDGLSKYALDSIDKSLAEVRDGLHEVQRALHAQPELAFEEHFAHDTCSAYMKKQGFVVTTSAHGLPTAWRAEFEVGEGGPVIGYNSEMDALRGIGHACGHNLIAVAGMAAAIATARLLEASQTAGKVVLLGTPAEEAYGGKSYLLKAGAYEGMSACLMVHPAGRGRGMGIPTLSCNAVFEVYYKGASAHAAGNPASGVNALDAAVAAYTNIALLRQQIGDRHRVYCTIKGSEHWTANIIASRSTLIVGVRCPVASEVYDLVQRVLPCLEAAALATGCDYEIKRQALYMDTQQSSGLTDYLRQVSKAKWDLDAPDMPTTAATDFGLITYTMPALHPMFNLPEAKAGDFPHSDTFADSTSSESATDAALEAASAIAAVGSRVILDRDWSDAVTGQWRQDMEAGKLWETQHKLQHRVEKYPLVDYLEAMDTEEHHCSC